MERQILVQREEVRQHWATAIQTYRTALGAYRRLLEMRAQRERGLPVRHDVVVLDRAQSFGNAAKLEALTPREREVADLIARGYSNQQIADELVLTRGTVANHVAHILAKIGAANRTQVAARVLEMSPHDALADARDDIV